MIIEHKGYLFIILRAPANTAKNLSFSIIYIAFMEVCH